MHTRTRLLIAGLTILCAASIGLSQNEQAGPQATPKPAGSKSTNRDRSKWRLAVMSYTFNKLTVFEAIDKTQQLGAHFMEGFSWQKVSPKHGNMMLNEETPEPVIQEVKKKLADAKVKLVTYYVADLGKDEAKTRQVFKFCVQMDIEAIVSEPDPKTLPMIDKLAEEYKVKVAIHNHPKDPKKPEYTNWDPASVMKLLEGRSKWIGCCADNGHWVRSGLDSVECLKKYQGRLVSLHLKDVNKVGPEAHDVPYGTGVVDLKAVMNELKRQDFAGVFSIEYESEKPDATADVTTCIEWFKKAKASLGVK